MIALQMEFNDAAVSLPDTPRLVLAADGETYFIAVVDRQHSRPMWVDAMTDEEIDSVIIAWSELPVFPMDEFEAARALQACRPLTLAEAHGNEGGLTHG